MEYTGLSASASGGIKSVVPGALVSLLFAFLEPAFTTLATPKLLILATESRESKILFGDKSRCMMGKHDYEESSNLLICHLK